MWLRLIACLLCFSGCGHEGTTPAQLGSTDPVRHGRESSSTQPAPAQPSSAPPNVVIRGEVLDGQVGIVVENHGALVELGTSVAIERQEGGTWSAIETGGIALRGGCDSEPSRCIGMTTGATFYAAPWLGTVGDAQCTCNECAPAPSGTYRFALTTCDGAHRVPGAPFVMEQAARSAQGAAETNRP